MAQLQEILNVQINDANDLHEEVTKMQRWGFLTASQALALRTHVSPALPCSLIVNMRTRKGVVYVTAFGAQSLSFSLSQRAKRL